MLGVSIGLLSANGGAYHYGVKSTGTLNPFEAEGVEKIAIMDERLDIDLERSSAVVNVRYWMKNTGEKRVVVRFGFPVELVGTEDLAFWQSDKRPSVQERLAKNLEGYAVWADGQSVKAAFREEKGTRKEKAKFDRRLAEIMGWMVSEVSFAKGQERIIQISYRSHYDEAGSFVSEDVRNGPKVFKYRLSTGAVWAGPIRKGTVTVTAKKVLADEVEMFKPVGRFKRDGVVWKWEFENLEPTLADDLEIRARPASKSFGVYGGNDDALNGYFEQAGIWSMEHRRFAIAASSVLAPQGEFTYDARHVKHWGSDEEFQAWSEGVEGDGLGEWLEITPKKVMPLYALSITPGYGKSEKLFAANNRPGRVEILLNGEHKFEARLDDEPENQVIRVLGYTKPVKKIRVTIVDVYPGSRHRDTCISYMTLYSRLKSKPEVRGAR